MYKLLLSLFCAVVFLAACGSDEQIGEGERTFRFEAVCIDENLQVWYVSTDAANVGDALLENGLVDGDMSEWGLFVTSVAGIAAPDGFWWSFYIDGEFAMTGVSDTPVRDSATYAFIIREATW